MQNNWFSGLANSKEHKSEHICKPKTTNIIPSQIDQPQVATQRMIDPTAYHKINHLLMLSQQDEPSPNWLWLPAPHPLAPGSPPIAPGSPPRRSRLPTPNLCFFFLCFFFFDLWSSSVLGHKSYQKIHASHTTKKSTKNTSHTKKTKNTSHTTKKHKRDHHKSHKINAHGLVSCHSPLILYSKNTTHTTKKQVIPQINTQKRPQVIPQKKAQTKTQVLPQKKHKNHKSYHKCTKKSLSHTTKKHKKRPQVIPQK